MGRKFCITFFLLLILVSNSFAQTPIWPEGEERKAKWRAFNGFALGVNPYIMGDMLKVYRAIPITSGSHFLTRDAHLRLGGATTVSPLLAKLGPFIGISPLLIWDVDFYWNQYFDFLHYRLENIDSPYDAHSLGEMESFFYWGQNFLFSSTFKLAYQGVVLFDILDIEYFLMKDTWYSIELVAAVNDGWDYTNKLALMYEFLPGWRIGTVWENFHIFNSGLTRHMLHLGFMADRKLPLDMTIFFLTGYHVVNPDFVGLRFWTAVIKEWDL